MKLSELKTHLQDLSDIRFRLPNNEYVPSHFHVTEIGKISKQFIDCGGTIRQDDTINFQLYSADDFDHRLAPQKLVNIISLSEKVLELEDLEIEVEYQSNTIGKYRLGYDEGDLLLLSTQTDCLAKEKCEIPVSKAKENQAVLVNDSGCCTPGSGCC